MIEIPSKNDWKENTLGEDALSAFDRFYGKSNDEMQKYFYRNVISAITEISSMPKVPFQYYLLGLCQYVVGAHLNEYESSAAASGFLNLVLQKFEEDFEFVEPLISELLPIIDHVTKNQEYYKANPYIYGSFEDKYQKILKLVEAKGGDGKGGGRI